MSVYYSEEELDNALYVKVFDKQDNEKATILVGNYNFHRFDRLKWLDNKTIGVYHINYTQSRANASKLFPDDFLQVTLV